MNRTFFALMLASVIMLIAPSGTSHAQSFSCAEATTAVEKQICSDANLSLMDTELGSVYAALKQELDDTEKASLESDERGWQRQRDVCGPDTACLTEAYLRRLQRLSGYDGVFPGWEGEFSSSAGLRIDVTEAGDREYSLALSGSGRDWTCDASIDASLSQTGGALVVTSGSGPVRVPMAGSGLWVPPAMDSVVKAHASCPTPTPSVSGFFARDVATKNTVPGFAEAPFVHPQIVNELVTLLSDIGDQVVAINLTEAQNSNRFAGAFKVEAADATGAAPIISMTDGDNVFSYQFVGSMANGIQVLKTVQSSVDGSGVFPSLMLLSFQEDHGIAVDWAANTIAAGPPRLLIVKHGEIAVGANRTGELKVEGDRLFIGPDQSGIPSPGAGSSGWLTYRAGPHSPLTQNN